MAPVMVMRGLATHGFQVDWPQGRLLSRPGGFAPGGEVLSGRSGMGAGYHLLLGFSGKVSRRFSEKHWGNDGNGWKSHEFLRKK